MSALAIAACLAQLIAGSAAVASPPATGTVAVALAAPKAADQTDDQPFADAVGDALGAVNFTLLPGHSRYLAEVSVTRERKGVVETRAAKDPASAGIVSWGPAIRMPLGSKKTQLRDLVATTLTVRLVTRADHAPVWRAAALTINAAGTPVAAKLARAAVATWPQTLATPVAVP